MEDMELADPNNTTAVVLRAPQPAMGKKPHPKKKRRPTGVNPLRVALFMVRRRTSGANKGAPLHAEVVKPSGRGFWKTLLAAMRPLHHQPQTPRLEHAGAAPATWPTSPPAAPGGDARDSFHDVATAPPSPSPSSNGLSQYDSADDLRALDTTGGSDDEDEGVGDGPHTIDLRAEEFIAKFYEQIRLQRLESTNGD